MSTALVQRFQCGLISPGYKHGPVLKDDDMQNYSERGYGVQCQDRIRRTLQTATFRSPTQTDAVFHITLHHPNTTGLLQFVGCFLRKVFTVLLASTLQLHDSAGGLFRLVWSLFS